MKIAIVHDWLVTYGGAERVLEHIIDCFPDADIFSLVDFLPERGCVRGKPVHTSFIQKMPFAKSRYRFYFPLFPFAIEQLDLAGYDLIISSSHAVAKGVLTGPDQVHISYVHSPMPYAWDQKNRYLQESGLTKIPKAFLTSAIFHYMRTWDTRTSNGVDEFIANSAFISRTIHKVHRRQSTVVYPPVDIEAFQMCDKKDDVYVTASQLVQYKKVDLIVQAFSATPWRKLIVIGSGPDMKKIAAMAGPNVSLLGCQPFDVLRDHLQRAAAFLCAAEEGFGIAAVEAQACGTPVIAFGRGGTSETVIGAPHRKPTGVFFEEQTIVSLLNAIDRFERMRHVFEPRHCRSNAERFSVPAFKSSMLAVIENAFALKKLADPHRYGYQDIMEYNDLEPSGSTDDAAVVTSQKVANG